MSVKSCSGMFDPSAAAKLTRAMRSGTKEPRNEMTSLATQHREVTAKQGVWEGGTAKESNSCSTPPFPLHLRTPGPDKQRCFSPNWFHRVLLHQQANSSRGYRHLACQLCQLMATAWPGGAEAKGYPKGKDVTLRVTVSTRQDTTEVWKRLVPTTEQ